MSKPKKLKIFLIAGEPSADFHGASLVEALKQKCELCVFGIGGDALKEQGMQLSYHLEKMAFMGVGEVIRHLPFIRKVHQELMQQAKQEKPDLAVLIDYPGFNLRIARSLKKEGIPVVYYISPKFWAWGSFRVKKVQKYVDKMLVLFPFEVEFYKRFGIEAVYVGNPLVDQHQKHLPDKEKPFDPKNAVLGILPGSRKQEVSSLMERMLQTARHLHRAGKIKSAEILKVANLPLQLYQDFLTEEDTFVHIAEKPMFKALPNYDAAIVASGTATLEAGYFGVPMLIVYHVNKLTYWLGRMVIKIDKVGLVNIVAEKFVAKEFLQDDFLVNAAEQEMLRLLSPEERKVVKSELKVIREKLGTPGASERAADEIIQFIENKN